MKEILLNHRGSDNPISSREINEEIDEDNIGSFPGTRAIIRDIVLEDRIPIAGGHNGYYVIETEEELEDYLDNLTSRINGMAERRWGVQRAANEWDAYPEHPEDSDVL
ncbi:hypothetical protein ACFQE1_01525 [Halobium palmae]|uniref:Transcriptional regulator n=1 Tax=Halobium palmae TaxID=1776492 RepID=A0ABD5RV48_9EURY